MHERSAPDWQDQARGARTSPRGGLRSVVEDVSHLRPAARRKLTARQRLDLLLDEGSLVESGALVRHRCKDFGLEERSVPGDGVVTGWGTIDGRLVYVISQDCTVFGGSVGEAGGRKICQILDLAVQNGAPVIALYDGGGGRIQEGVDGLAGFSEILWRHSITSGVVPQVSAVMGACTGGAAYSPALTDFIFMTEDGYMSLTGPEVIRAVTHKEVTLEEIGGAAVHGCKTGLAHFVKLDDVECLCGIRELLSFLPSNNLDPACPGTSADCPSRCAKELQDLISTNPNEPYDMKRLIRAVVDDGRFLELQEEHAKNLIVGFARFANDTVGIVASQPNYLAGALTIDAAIKGARFVRFCDAFHIPLVTFVDSPGYLPSLDEELGGVIRHGAKLLYAYAEATAPKITIITRKAYGGAYAALGSKQLRSDVNLAYPGAEIAVVGAEGAVGVLYRRELQRAGNQAGELRLRLLEEYRRKIASPFPAAERGYIDGIIDPAETRPAIIRALRGLMKKRAERPRKKHSNMPL
jgi:propionyl-CoA carboxylase beta chain